jgi:hypothetical protein
MNNTEYFRNSCGITGNVLPNLPKNNTKNYDILFIDMPPKKAFIDPFRTAHPREINGDKTPRLPPQFLPKVRKIKTPDDKTPRLPAIPPPPPKKKSTIPKLKLNNVNPVQDENDAKKFNIYKNYKKRVENSKSIQEAREENNIFNYRYIKKLQEKDRLLTDNGIKVFNELLKSHQKKII